MSRVENQYVFNVSSLQFVLMVILHEIKRNGSVKLSKFIHCKLTEFYNKNIL